MLDFKPVIEALTDELIEFRHDLHAHPETAFAEKRTASRVVMELSKLENLRITSDIAGTGVVAVLNARRGSPCVALRADLDALPLTEKTDLPYASRHPGKMHACGHDGHTTCLVGAARVLHRFAEQLPGAVKFIFQPAEEGGAGARKMIEAGVLDAPRVDAAFAFHGWPGLPLGTVAVDSGPVLAAAHAFDITLTGRGTHAAYPHQGSDVILAAAHLITMVQAIRTRFIDPLDPAVVSICQVAAGDAYNLLPDTCRLKGTYRTLRPTTTEEVRSSLERMVRTVPELFKAQAEYTELEPYPALVNNAACADLVAEVAAEIMGPEHVERAAASGMGAEDFAFFAQAVPSAWFRLGLRPPGEAEMAPLHNPRFDFSDAAISWGVHLHCAIAYRFLTSPPTWKCG
jgi:amidohydrolase